MVLPSMKDLLEAGVHFGHQSKRWHPKMQPYIFTEREGIHVIDLEQTVDRLEKAANFLKNLASHGGKIIFVSTKEQGASIVKEEAIRAGAMHVTKRWTGGTLTNFETMRAILSRLSNLEAQKESGELEKYTKREQLLIARDIDKLNNAVGGLKGLEKLPDALFVLDTKKEINAVREAKKTGVTVVGVVDTNCDPTVIDYVIPANDDAIRAIKVIVKTIADAVEEGYAEFNHDEKVKADKQKETEEQV